MGSGAENFDIAPAALLDNSRAEAEQVEKLEAKINQYEKSIIVSGQKLITSR